MYRQPGGIRTIDARNVEEESIWSELYSEESPAVVRGLGFGPSERLWRDPDYLAKAGGSMPVSVQIGPNPQMDFLDKNFQYRVLPFNELVYKAASTSPNSSDSLAYYFRSSPNRTSVADFWTQWPGLAGDLRQLQFIPKERVYSSVLRLSSKGCELFTHYDMFDNILLQVSGHKHVVLFSPSDMAYMYVKGDKSRVRDPRNPDLQRFPLFRYTTPFECMLAPGDALFIPAFWFHNVKAMDFCVGVNVFWRRLDRSYYDPKDMFGNRDLVAGRSALQGLDNAIRTLKTFPVKCYREFYARRFIEKLKHELLEDAA